MSRTATSSVAVTSGLADLIEKGITLRALYTELNKGMDPDAPNGEGTTPMAAAIERGWWQAADMLLSFGAKPPAYEGDPNGPPQLNFQTGDSQRETALTYMLKKATWFNPVYTLLANGADINLKNRNDETPLAAVVARGWPHAAVELAKRGAWIDPENPDQDEILDRKTGASRLLCTILQGQDPQAIEKMLKDGADPNKADRFGLTPLAAALALNWDYVAEKLRAYGAKEETAALPDPNQALDDGQPLLVYAINYQNCHENYIHALLAHGADPNAADSEGRTAVHWAAIMGKENVFDALWDAGGDILRETKPDNGLRPLHFACLNNQLDIVQGILESSPPGHINEPYGENGQTPLHFAVQHTGSSELVALLVDHGALVNLPDAKGETAIFRAVDRRDPAVVRALLHRGADVARPSTKSELNPPLFRLVNSPHENNLEIASLLLDHGADPNGIAHTKLNGPSIGESLIHFALRYRANELSSLLLKNGASPHGTDESGESAAHYCLHLRLKEGLKILLENGFDPLRVFDYNQKWHASGGDVIEEHHKGSALDCARELAQKFPGHNEYSDMLEMIENHIATHKPAPRRKTVPRPS